MIVKVCSIWQAEINIAWAGQYFVTESSMARSTAAGSIW
jgi:hypothetical protein